MRKPYDVWVTLPLRIGDDIVALEAGGDGVIVSTRLGRTFYVQDGLWREKNREEYNEYMKAYRARKREDDV